MAGSVHKRCKSRTHWSNVTRKRIQKELEANTIMKVYQDNGF